MALARKRRIADSTEDRVFYVLNAVILTLLLFVTLYPLYFVIIASVSDYRAVGTGQVLFWPKGFSLFAYQKVFQKQSVLIGYRNTIFYTIVGTAINLGLTLLTGYALSVKFPGRRIANFFIVFTMYFSGGIIPTYFVIRDLHLLNTIWVMLLPGAISAYNLILTRSFIQSSIPQELYEAASIDGCTRIQYFLKIVLPLSGVLVSVMTLFYAVGHWNSYFNAMMYIDDVNLFPLQLVLQPEHIQSGKIIRHGGGRSRCLTCHRAAGDHPHDVPHTVRHGGAASRGNEVLHRRRPQRAVGHLVNGAPLPPVGNHAHGILKAGVHLRVMEGICPADAPCHTDLGNGGNGCGNGIRLRFPQLQKILHGLPVGKLHHAGKLFPVKSRKALV